MPIKQKPNTRSPNRSRQRISVEQIARAVASHMELNLQSLRSPSRREGASRARAMTAYLGRLCGQIPNARTAAYFNRDGSSVAKDVRALDQDLRNSKTLHDQLDSLARRLIRTSST